MKLTAHYGAVLYMFGGSSLLILVGTILIYSLSQNVLWKNIEFDMSCWEQVDLTQGQHNFFDHYFLGTSANSLQTIYISFLTHLNKKNVVTFKLPLWCYYLFNLVHYPHIDLCQHMYGFVFKILFFYTSCIFLAQSHVMHWKNEQSNPSWRCPTRHHFGSTAAMISLAEVYTHQVWLGMTTEGVGGNVTRVNMLPVL